MSITQNTSALDEVRKLKPEFEKKYIQNLQGKDFVLYNGLVILAKAKGIKSLDTQVLQFPTQANAETTIVKATIVGWDTDPDGNRVEVTYTGIGDANPGNCNKMVGKHAIRMAETRAKGRAMRDYIGIDAVMFEELGDGPFESNDPSKKPITSNQVSQITSLKTALGWNTDVIRDFASKICGTADLATFSQAMGDKLIAAMQEESKIAGK